MKVHILKHKNEQFYDIKDMNFHDISPICFCYFGIFLPEDDLMYYNRNMEK